MASVFRRGKRVSGKDAPRYRENEAKDKTDADARERYGLAKPPVGRY